ncbi:MAG TPA: hypothetical protein VFO10_12520 [Oligoflexus sp.]|uniref:hypothetical protein n=1 Tax=Oligoflexus sp. TaxID=1971216 RepID=UPI002D7EFD32|nr:hypothetical protein [Oligoflexus sp.]HET9238074.1 hypothetical protein [Oligoflexus sp.]
MVQRPYKLALGYAILGFAAFGCGSSHSSSDKKPLISEPPRVTASAASLNLTSTSADARLNGVWKSKCVENPDGSSSSTTLEITDNYLQQTMSLFRFSGCYSLAMDARFITTYAAQKSEMTTTLKQTHLNVYETLFAQAAQKGSSCGFNGWRTGVWYDLTDKVCVQSRDGVWVTPTRAGTKNTTAFDITVANSEVKINMGGMILTRPVREGDKPSVMPQPPQSVTPITGFLFADRSAQDVETFLKNWGCVVSLEFGVSQCPAPKTLDEASDLIDQLIAFGHAVSRDANFEDNSAARTRLSNGSLHALGKAAAFPAYASVQKSLEDGLASLHDDYPQFDFRDLYNVNAIRASAAVGALRQALETLELQKELVRLRVTRVYASDSRQYGKDEAGVFVFWDGHDTAEKMMEFLKAQTPVSLSPGSAASLKKPTDQGLGFQAQAAE